MSDPTPSPTPRPYYDEDGITIYHGDCVEILPTLGQFDMAFTSPPYNISTRPDGKPIRGGKWAGLEDGYENSNDTMTQDGYEDWLRRVLLELWDHTTGAIFFNHKPRPWNGTMWLPTVLNPGLPLRQIVTWQRAGGVNFSESFYVPTYEWILILAREGWRLRSKGASGVGDVWTVPQEANNSHPAPFPIGLPARAIETTAPTSVIDPFMGSGTTLRAAKDAGIPSTGIELSERYCEIAVKRLAQGVFL